MFCSQERRPSRGFTLIEIMLVVGLMAVFVALVYPYYGDYRNRVKVTQAIGDIVGMEASVELYRAAHSACPGSLADMNLAGKLDPWGNPYVYYNIEANGKGGARKDHALNPLNPDYDLYSMGPDGQTSTQLTAAKARDDILRANNGRFMGIASTYDP